MRRIAFIAGVVVLVGGWVIAAAGYGVTGHMTAHMAAVSLAAPLIAIGLAGTRADLAMRWPVVIAPLPMSLVELLVVWGWHVPAARAFAAASAGGLVTEQAMFLGAGLLLWSACLGTRNASSSTRRAAGVIALLLTTMHMTLLGVLVALAPRTLFDTAGVTCLGASLSPLADQQLGGVVMLVVGAGSYLLGGLALLSRFYGSSVRNGRAMVLRITAARAVGAIAALLVIGIVIAWLGVINIAASTGHWMITDKLLHWAMRNAVRTRSALTVENPGLDPTGLISAAGHYAATCAICHGAPGERPSVVMQATTPPAPDLTVTASEWSDRQLLWIVKHGVKFTPMPAWPTQDRNDEVRRMAAFVRRLPNMTPATYRELAYGTGRIGGPALTRMEDALPDCERCHADEGRERPDVPLLAGQKQAYLLATLNAYASGGRASGVMGAAAARLDRDTMHALANHYASLPADLYEYSALSRSRDENKSAATSEEAFAKHIVENGLPAANLPACVNCHAPSKRPDYPLLAGQKPEYMAARLRRWRGDANVVDARKPNESMPMICATHSRRNDRAAARYYAEH